MSLKNYVVCLPDNRWQDVEAELYEIDESKREGQHCHLVFFCWMGDDLTEVARFAEWSFVLMQNEGGSCNEEN